RAPRGPRRLFRGRHRGPVPRGRDDRIARGEAREEGHDGALPGGHEGRASEHRRGHGQVLRGVRQEVQERRGPGPPGREHPLSLRQSRSGRYLSISLLDGNSMPPGSAWRTWITRVLTLGPSRIALGLAVLLVAVVLALFSLEYGRAMPTLSLLILSLIVLGVALVALFFPIVAIPGAATTDVGTFTINGFWGSASTAGPPTGWSWGPGLGWWILLVAVVLGTVGAVLPYVKSIRAMIPSPPPGWRPSP